jgi:hypothetical protein
MVLHIAARGSKDGEVGELGGRRARASSGRVLGRVVQRAGNGIACRPSCQGEVAGTLLDVGDRSGEPGVDFVALPGRHTLVTQ